MRASVYDMATTTAPVRTSLKSVSAYIQQRIPFSCNDTLSGRANGGYGKGELPVQYWGDYTKAEEAPDFFVVRSYITPIAWYANGTWHVPNTSYSPTTSKHLNALGLPLNRRATKRLTKYITLGGL